MSTTLALNTLADELLAFDKANPGDPDADVEVDGETWARWVALAKGEQPKDQCGAVDGGDPCLHDAGHTGPHSNGRRTWSAKKRRRA